MGWLTGLITGWSERQQAKEMVDFIRRTAAADGEELGLPLAMALDLRNTIRRESNLDLLYPAAVLQIDPFAILPLARKVKQQQAAGDLLSAAATIIWVHTLRAMTSHELRPYGRQLWGELSRGFPHIVAGADQFYAMTRIVLDITGRGQFPDGLTPERR